LFRNSTSIMDVQRAQISVQCLVLEFDWRTVACYSD
jgi:hypothetical protein